MTPQEILSKALETLRSGGVILYPTDTVWGLGCDAANPDAVRKIYEIKHRDDSKSLVLLASDMDMVARYVKAVPSMAIDLVEVNDRPMTIIYPQAIAQTDPAAMDKYHLAANVVAEDGSVGIRIPMIQFCRDLAFKLGRPIVSTSANISGGPTPKRLNEIVPEVREAVDFTVPPSMDKESTGQPSQIIRVEMDGQVKIIRM